MRIKLYSILAAAALTVGVQSSCKKDFLDKQPFNQVTADKAFVDLAGAEKLLSGAYGGMYNNTHIWDFMLNGDVTADNAYDGGDNPSIAQMDNFVANSANEILERDWSELYSQIKNTNQVLNNVPNIKDPELDKNDRRNQILGEASGIRAYLYFYLVRLWGRVPIVLTTPNNLEDMQVKRSSVDEVYALIIKDLEFALANTRTTGPNKGIFTKGVANALLAKVYATKPNPDWAKVNQYADAVIGGGYSLFNSYDGLFTGTNKNNAESIWEMQFDGGGSGNRRGNWMPGIITGSGWKRFCTPTNDLAAAFDAEGDVVRKNSSIKFLNSSSEGWSDAYWPKSNFPYINKYRNDDKTNIYIIRLADILLLKAEALNELSAGGWAQSKVIVDQIRSRVSLGGTPAADQPAMRLALEKERRLELAFEGHRWYDLLRTNRAIAVMNAQKNGAGVALGYNVTQDKLLLLMSQKEIDRNQSINK